MQVKSFVEDFLGEPVVFEEIEFGQCVYIYVGSTQRPFDDLTLTMPARDAQSHLLGSKPTRELGSLVSSLLKKPVLFSYSFPLEGDRDAERFLFVKTALSKRFTQK
jgi:hypothetical protein